MLPQSACRAIHRLAVPPFRGVVNSTYGLFVTSTVVAEPPHSVARAPAGSVST